jgi:hypothetical protein
MEPVSKTSGISQTHFSRDISEFWIFSLQSHTQFLHFRIKYKFKKFILHSSVHLGRGASFESVPFYWTVHYGRSVRVVGHYTAGGGEDENIDVQQAALGNRNYFLRFRF